MSELVSVIVPIYNVEDYLKECITSLVNQTYKHLEILLIDDGSTDNSGKMADKIAGSDDRIKVIHQKNGGLSAARNTGIENCKGDYICFVDSDDYVKKSYVEELLNACIENKTDMAICMFFGVQNGKELFSESDGSSEIITPKQACMRTLDNPYIVSWNKIYKRDIFDDIRFPEGRLHEDVATTYKCYWKSNRIVVINKELYGYRVNDSGIMRTKYSSKRYDELKAVREAINFFSDKDEDVCKKYYLMFFIRSISHLRRTAMNPQLKKEYYKKLQKDAINIADVYKNKYGNSMKLRRLIFGIYHPSLYKQIMKLRKFKRK